MARELLRAVWLLIPATVLTLALVGMVDQWGISHPTVVETFRLKKCAAVAFPPKSSTCSRESGPYRRKLEQSWRAETVP